MIYLILLGIYLIGLVVIAYAIGTESEQTDKFDENVAFVVFIWPVCLFIFLVYCIFIGIGKLCELIFVKPLKYIHDLGMKKTSPVVNTRKSNKPGWF